MLSTGPRKILVFFVLMIITSGLYAFNSPPFDFNTLVLKSKRQFTPLYQHPFNVKLANGSLPITVFNAYLEEDKRYLSGYALALKRIANRYKALGYTHAAHFLLTQLHETIQLEQALNKKQYFVSLTRQSLAMPVHLKKSVITAYLKHLETSSHHPVLAVALASITPCFWIYYQLGIRLHQTHPNAYQHWISTYADPSYQMATLQLIALLDKEIRRNPLTVIEKQQVLNAFQRSVQLEYEFIDELYPSSKKDRGTL